MESLANDTKTTISGVLVSSKYRMTIRQLSTDFREQVGYDIPYSKLGYDTLELYLHSINDTVQVLGLGNNAQVIAVNKKSAHVSEMVAKQKFPKGHKNRVKKSNYRVEAPRFYPQYNERSFFNLYSSSPHANFSRPRRFNNEFEYFSNTYDTYATAPVKSRTYENSKNIDRTHNSNSESSHYASFSNTSNNTEIDTTLMFKPTGQNAASYFDKDKSAVRSPKNSHDLSKPTEKKNGTESFCCTENTLSVNQGSVVKSCSNFETSSRVSNEKESSAASFSVLSDDEVFYSDEEESNTRVPLIIQNNLQKLVKSYPDGVWCAKIPDLYKKEFGDDLEYMDYGYVSLAQMCLDLGNMFHCIQPDHSDYKLFDKSLHITNDNLKSLKISEYLKIRATVQETTEPALPDIGLDELLINIHQHYIPLDIVKRGTYIERQWIKPSDKEENFIDINVAEVYDPSKFWFNLKIHSVQLNKLMDNMQMFYEANAEIYAVPKLALSVGLYISVVFLKEYHRAVIVDTELLSSKNLFRAFFIDYGSVSLVSSVGVCYLHEQFAVLPAQAIRARLAGIYPPHRHQQWSRSASSFFLTLVKDKDLVAQIRRIYTEKELLEIVLADTSDEEDLFINDALVFEKHAHFMSQAQLEPIESNFIPIVSYIHLFPTFDELETAKVPNATEMIHFENAGIGVERIYPRYFKDAEENSTSEGVSHSWKFDYDLAEKNYTDASKDNSFELNEAVPDRLNEHVVTEKKHDWIELISDEDILNAFEHKPSNSKSLKNTQIQSETMKTPELKQFETQNISTNLSTLKNTENTLEINSTVSENPVLAYDEIVSVSKIKETEIQDKEPHETNELPEQISKTQLLNPEKPPFVPLSQMNTVHSNQNITNTEIKKVSPPPGFNNIQPRLLEENQYRNSLQNNSVQQILNITPIHQLQFILQNVQPKNSLRDLSLLQYFYPHISAEVALLYLQNYYQGQNIIQESPVFSCAPSSSQPNFYSSVYPQVPYYNMHPQYYAAPPYYTHNDIPSALPHNNNNHADFPQPILKNEINENKSSFDCKQNIATATTKLKSSNISQSTTDCIPNLKVHNSEIIHRPLTNIKSTDPEPVTINKYEVQVEREHNHVVSEQKSNKSIIHESSEETEVMCTLKENETCAESKGKEEAKTYLADNDCLNQNIINEIWKVFKNANNQQTQSSTMNNHKAENKDVEKRLMEKKKNITNQGMESNEGSIEDSIKINTNQDSIKCDSLTNLENFFDSKGDYLHKQDEEQEIACVKNRNVTEYANDEKQDILKSITKHVLGNLTMHIINHNGNIYFPLEEISYNLLGKSFSVVQIKKMFIGKEHSISFFDINLKKNPLLKKELSELDLIKKTALMINVIAVSDASQFVKILTKDSKQAKDFEIFLKDLKKLWPIAECKF